MKKPLPKKSAVKKVSAKKINAPKAFKPAGKPKEYLAYLNKREMELLKKFNGGTIKLGPRGLPSFADDSASSQGVSRGDKSQATKGSGSSPGPNGGSVSNKSTSSGPRGPAGPGGEPRSSPAGNAGGSPGSTSRNSGNAGAGQGGQNSGTKGPSNSLNAPNRTAPSSPKSPMGGQGTSFKTPAAASSYNKTVAKPSSPMGGQGTSFSTPQKAAAYNRGVAPKTPQSPMSNQGTSFRTPEAASYYNKNVVPGTGTGLRGPLGPQGQSKAPGTPMSLKSSGLPRAPGSDIEQRGSIMAPFDKTYELEQALERNNQAIRDYLDERRREIASILAGPLRTPQEISELVKNEEQFAKQQYVAERNRDLNADRSFRATDPYRQRSEDYEARRALNSARLPDVRLPSSAPRGGYMAGPSYRAGGLVRRTFKNK